MSNFIATIRFSDLVAKYNELLREAARFNYLVRDSDLQQKLISDLEDFRLVIKQAKESAIQSDNERLANLLFVFQCIVNSYKSVLEMWLQLKQFEPSVAWERLIDAQEYASIALRVEAPAAYGIQDYVKRLSAIEQTVFPGWPMFMSPGLIEEGFGQCSICNMLYEECDSHLEGCVYWGQLCERVNRKIVGQDHTAFVETPHDKRCIIKYIATDDGRKRDYITWAVLDERFESAETTGGRMMDVVILNTRRLDVD